jgi:hypothetical protein
MDEDVPLVDDGSMWLHAIRGAVVLTAEAIYHSDSRICSFPHTPDLPFELLGQPLIIAIQEGDELTAG